MGIKNNRFVTLDGMRGIAALVVMVRHFSQHTATDMFSGAGVAVDLFFCLSGFVIAYSYLDRLQGRMSLGEFVTRRLVRLYPMFLFGIFFGSFALVLKILFGQSTIRLDDVALVIFLNSIYLPYFSDFYVQIGNGNIHSPVFPANDPSWSLFFEFFVNVLFAGFAIYFRRFVFYGVAVVGFGALLIYAVAYKISAPGWGVDNFFGGFPRVVYGFFSGVVVYFLWDRFRERIPVVRPVFLMFFLLLFFLKESGVFWLFGALFVVPVLVLVGAVSQSLSEAAQKRYEYLGWISYPVYCLHFPIYSIFTSLTGNLDFGVWGVVICSFVTILLSHLLAKFFDEPIRALLSAKLFALKES